LKPHASDLAARENRSGTAKITPTSITMSDVEIVCKACRRLINLLHPRT